MVVSNTTEAGIAYHEGDCLSDRPPVSFPAKITAFLYERYQAFHGDPEKGLLFLPVELIDNNGAELKRLVLRYAREWGLEDSFLSWVEKANAFASTLVDRIVTGYPREEADAFEKRLGYQDQLLDIALNSCSKFNAAACPLSLTMRTQKAYSRNVLPFHWLHLSDFTSAERKAAHSGASARTVPLTPFGTTLLFLNLCPVCGRQKILTMWQRRYFPAGNSGAAEI